MSMKEEPTCIIKTAPYHSKVMIMACIHNILNRKAAATEFHKMLCLRGKTVEGFLSFIESIIIGFFYLLEVSSDICCVL